MIFRTGSVLIVGMCEEYVLNVIYDFLTALLKTEFHNICQNILGVKHTMIKDKNKKIRRKSIIIIMNPEDSYIVNATNEMIPISEIDEIIEIKSSKRLNKKNPKKKESKESKEIKEIKESNE